MIAQDLPRVRHRILRRNRPVGIDLDRELLVVRLLSDARCLDVVANVDDRREDRIDRDHAQRLLGRLVLFRHEVPDAAADPEVEFEIRFAIERRDMEFRIKDLHVGRRLLDLRRGQRQRSLQRDDDAVGLLVDKLHPDLFQVQDHLRHILHNARDGGELMLDPVDLERRDGVSGE